MGEKTTFGPATPGPGEHVAADCRRVRLPVLAHPERVSKIFGGSLYAAIDPFFMIMLMKNLGPAYVVWDKAPTIRFRKPARNTQGLLPAGRR